MLPVSSPPCQTARQPGGAGYWARRAGKPLAKRRHTRPPTRAPIRQQAARPRRRSSMSRRMRTTALAACLALAVGLGTASPTAGQGGPTGASGPTGPTGSAPIPIIVLHGSSGQAVALVRVSIGSTTGPFIIDTGATKTLVDKRAAARLKLAPAGRVRRISGIGCTQSAQPVHLTNWKIDAIDL